mmetsp:Transcript_13474/g.50151  ORF Transcript_13474/g.50151 Transcript_13474/m.50151 type:complete len:238 (-) Transcript_13474:1951-2664(-)
MRRPSSTPDTIEAKLSSRRIISAAFFDTSEPAIPMATPMSPFLSAGESLTPSPVTATMCPRRWLFSTMTSFCCGDVRANTICGCMRISSQRSWGISALIFGPGTTMASASSGSMYPGSPAMRPMDPSGRAFSAFLRMMSSRVSPQRMPTLFAIAAAVFGWSPVTMITLIPAVLQRATAPGTASRGGSMSAMRPRKTIPSLALGWKGLSLLGSSASACTSASRFFSSKKSPMGKLLVS